MSHVKHILPFIQNPTIMAMKSPRRSQRLLRQRKERQRTRLATQAVTAQPMPYQYSPLNEDAHEIRILTLLPGPSSSEICVCLEATSFTTESVSEFEALSYAWSSAADPVNILVGQSGYDTLSVTKNLAEALLHLRYEDNAHHLWIDAICVNQRDLRERSSQVQRANGRHLRLGFKSCRLAWPRVE